jgi:hypothetical protein
MAALRRFAGKVADVVGEMNYAQRRMLVLRTAPDRYTDKAGAPPDSYREFLFRTSGVLLHEPAARKRTGQARRE